TDFSKKLNEDVLPRAEAPKEGAKIDSTKPLDFSQTDIGEKTWRHGAFPLVDFSGKQVGTVVVSVDETAGLAAAASARNVTLAIVLVGGLLLLFGLDALARKFVIA